MKTDPNAPASAQRLSYPYPEWNPDRSFNGLTVRELFAAMNFADGFSDLHDSATDEQLLTQARLCCRGADALIAALNEECK